MVVDDKVWFSQDRETANGGTAPRMLCLDDYFITEVEKIVNDDSGKKVKKMVSISYLHRSMNLAVLIEEEKK